MTVFFLTLSNWLKKKVTLTCVFNFRIDLHCIHLLCIFAVCIHMCYQPVQLLLIVLLSASARVLMLKQHLESYYPG